MLEIKDLFKIGIGTYKLDFNNKEETMNGLIYSSNSGQNYIDISSLYDDGNAIKFIGEFLKRVDRNKVFINCKISTFINNVNEIEEALNKYLEIMDIDYVDCLELDEPQVSKIPLIDSYKELNRLVSKGKARYLGISNCSFEILKEINSVIKIDIFDSLYNLECKMNEDMGILDYCNKHNIVFVCYQPLRRNRTANRNYPLLLDLSKKYNKTQNQIILNWIVKEKNILPIVRTTKKDKIKENIESLDFIMSKEDYESLNSFRAKDFDSLKVSFNENEEGIAIDKIPNQFE